MKNIAVILASGSGTRADFDRPKQIVKLAGQPVIAYALETFQRHPEIDEIAVVTNQECFSTIEQLVLTRSFTKVKRLLLGGEERYHSSYSAIKAYESEAETRDVRLIFHDAVRPLVDARIISDVVRALAHFPAVDVAVPATDTIIFVDPESNIIRDIPDRRMARAGQTPQAFHFDVIKRAYEAAMADPAFRATDDCGVVLKYAPDAPIYVVDGELSNMKLTYRSDLLLLDKLLQNNAHRRSAIEEAPAHFGALRGKCLVVIGGTSGIGASLVKIAKAHGANVYSAGKSSGVDVRDSASVARYLDEVAEREGEIHACVNTAGVLLKMPFSNMSDEEVRESIETNFLGAVNVARVAYPHLARSRGHLMFFASSSYTYGRAFYSTYSASKAGIVNFVQALAEEWAEVGIKVNCINPARADTPMRTRAFGIEPPGTLLDPDDIARRALSVLVGSTSGFIYDVVKA